MTLGKSCLLGFGSLIRKKAGWPGSSDPPSRKKALHIGGQYGGGGKRPGTGSWLSSTHQDSATTGHEGVLQGTSFPACPATQVGSLGEQTFETLLKCRHNSPKFVITENKLLQVIKVVCSSCHKSTNTQAYEEVLDSNPTPDSLGYSHPLLSLLTQTYIHSFSFSNPNGILLYALFYSLLALLQNISWLSFRVGTYKASFLTMAPSPATVKMCYNVFSSSCLAEESAYFCYFAISECFGHGIYIPFLRN